MRSIETAGAPAATPAARYVRTRRRPWTAGNDAEHRVRLPGDAVEPARPTAGADDDRGGRPSGPASRRTPVVTA